MLLTLAACLLLGTLGSTLIAPQANSSADVFYQSFNWDVLSQPRSSFYGGLSNELDNLRGAGIDGIWFPPPSQTADQQGYLPGEWYNIRDGSSLSQATQKARQMGLKVIMDIVINHRSGQAVDGCTGQYTVFYQPNWGNWGVVKNDGLCNGGVEVPDNCNPGNWDTGENACYSPDVDHTNNQVQNDIINWLKWLQSNFSVNAYRYDFVKGYNGQYVHQYNTATGPQFSVGEFFDSDTGKVMNWIQQTQFSSTAFDFPNRNYIKNAINSNDYSSLQQSVNPAGLLGVYPGYACPFLDNHDTARNDRFCQGNWDKLKQGYAYILTHPGYPFIFHDDWYTPDIQSAIRTLIQIRKQHQLGATAPIYIDAHQYGLYAAYLGPGATYRGGGTVAMKLGTNDWSPAGGGWNLATSGNNYAVWTKY